MFCGIIKSPPVFLVVQSFDEHSRVCFKIQGVSAILAGDKGCHRLSAYWDSYRAVFDKKSHKRVGKQSGKAACVERCNNTLG
ncbi:MAG: hypothetical protein COX01_00380 [Verrucomicrobia bacterium CG22_combo_CG10-13_8_21_14_all_43_17]|nr:MAG: hypothetical protein AUJ82_06005 [Verrucomicrobia bacterium CG1_02_43_26]PIP60053.1 MAG: hypothetical protein COX01_00380 [Verrucomicrobia bacterium CG22_combo_CG10-13_8_21_14_all_43_17]